VRFDFGYFYDVNFLIFDMLFVRTLKFIFFMNLDALASGHEIE